MWINSSRQGRNEVGLHLTEIADYILYGTFCTLFLTQFGVTLLVQRNEFLPTPKIASSYSNVNFFLFGATVPPVGQGLPIPVVSRSHQRHTTVGRTPLDEWSALLQRPLPDNIRQSQQTDILAPGGIRTHNLSMGAGQAFALERTVTGTGNVNLSLSNFLLHSTKVRAKLLVFYLEEK